VISPETKAQIVEFLRNNTHLGHDKAVLYLADMGIKCSAKTVSDLRMLHGIKYPTHYYTPEQRKAHADYILANHSVMGTTEIADNLGLKVAYVSTLIGRLGLRESKVKAKETSGMIREQIKAGGLQGQRITFI
jgi:hypothetical protein